MYFYPRTRFISNQIFMYNKKKICQRNQCFYLLLITALLTIIILNTQHKQYERNIWNELRVIVVILINASLFF